MIDPTKEKFALNQARSGNSAAFEALIGAYHHSLYRCALKMTRSEEDAEDVVQEAVLKAYCRLDQFEGRSRFYTWLTRIVVNEARMKLRKRRSNRETESLEPDVIRGKQDEAWHASKPYEHPEAYYQSVELRNILRGALTVLHPSLSAPFLLCYHEGYSVREIAAKLGLSATALKSRLYRARHMLGRRLRPLFKAPPTRAATAGSGFR